MMHKMKCLSLVLLSASVLGCGAPDIDYSGPVDDWRHAGNSADGMRYSPLDQIDKDNVDQLKEVWRYKLGEASDGYDGNTATALQVTPLIIDDTMYVCSPYNRVIALDPETGAEVWVFDPKVDRSGVYSANCRGVSYFESPKASQCPKRLFMGTIDGRLFAINAETGAPCAGFGNNGEIDLKQGLGDVRPGEYYVTSPPLVVNNLVIPNAFIQDGQRTDAPGGGIRAFDAKTGDLVWVWDPVPPGVKPVTARDLRQGQTLSRSTPNSWGLMSASPDGSTIYIPTGGPQPDHYGGKERGDLDYYGTSVVALDAKTGKRKWHFQTVHHDIWDYDVAAQPVVYPREDGSLAVVAATKQGHIFLLDSETGESLFPVEERAVPQTDSAGEYTSPTQPFPTTPAPLHPSRITEDDLFGVFPGDKDHCEKIFAGLRHDGIYTPPSLEGTLVNPGIGGGINWGSVSIDPVARRMIVNQQINPFLVQLVRREDMSGEGARDLVGFNPQEGTPYVVSRNFFTTPFPDMRPCIKPPWGKITAIDIDSGEILWDKPLGNLNGLAPFGVGRFLNWGVPNTGGSVQTASGLIFIAATMDRYFRAFDADTGEVLWQQELPYSAHATPATYRLREDGKQYVVIAAGGHAGIMSPTGDTLIAFALKDE